MSDTQKQTKWFDLLSLVRLCPGEVSEIKPAQKPIEEVVSPQKRKRGAQLGMISISGNTRLLLFAFAQHAAGDTDETWVSRRVLMAETQMSINTLDTAIAGLKQAGLLRTRKDFNEVKGDFRHIWIIQRVRLAELVGKAVDQKVINSVIEAAISDGSSSLECSPARLEQTRSALWEAAGSTLIDIHDVPGEKMVRLTVSIRGTQEQVIPVVPAAIVSKPPAKIGSMTPSREKYILSEISELRDPNSLSDGSVGIEIQISEFDQVRNLIERELPGAEIEETAHRVRAGNVHIRVRWTDTRNWAA